MINNPIVCKLRDNAFPIVLFSTVIFVVAKAIVAGMSMHEGFANKGNDDIMRMLTVRDWLAGQGWYDVVQYRLIPPDGVSLHWSRYIDAGIAMIIVPLSWVMPMTMAETTAATIWPTLILLVTLLSVAFGTRRVFGTAASCFAVLCFALWPLTANLHSRAGNLDHHNVQMLLMVLMAFSVVWPSRHKTAGYVGGIAGSLSLAVGLESLVFVVGVGVVALARTIIEKTRKTNDFLMSFCLALSVGSVVLWLGQTGPDVRMDLMCDQLAPPTLALVVIASIACMLSVITTRFSNSSIVGFGSALLVVTVGLGLAWPLVSHCLAGPYAQIPPELQELISTRITEAKPGLLYARKEVAASLVLIIPIFAAILAGVTQWYTTRNHSSGNENERNALGILLLLCVFSVPLMFLQMRAVIVAASVVPMIGGVIVAHRVRLYFVTRELKDGLLALFFATVVISPMTVVLSLQSVLPTSENINSEAHNDCRNYNSLVALNEVPPAIILNHLNFGPSLLWATHHSALAAPYHRSADAFMNGVLPFQMEEAELAEYVSETNATHLLLCKGFKYGSEFLRGISDGEMVDWLHFVPVSSEEQLLFEILREDMPIN